MLRVVVVAPGLACTMMGATGLLTADAEDAAVIGTTAAARADAVCPALDRLLEALELDAARSAGLAFCASNSRSDGESAW